MQYCTISLFFIVLLPAENNSLSGTVGRNVVALEGKSFLALL